MTCDDVRNDIKKQFEKIHNARNIEEEMTAKDYLIESMQFLASMFEIARNETKEVR
jgi:hypothetical protein